NQGNIRMRSYGAYGDRQFNISIPESGITPDQLKELKRMAPQMGTGRVYLEVGKPGGESRNIDYGKTDAESLEKNLRELEPIVPEGYPKGTPAVSGGAPDEVLDKIKTKVNVVPRGEIDVDTLNDGTVRHYLLSDGSMVSEKVPIHSDIGNKVGKETLSKAKGIRMAGPQEFDIYSKPTTQQTAELSRITKEANESYGGKMYWTIKPNFGGDIGGAGSFGDFQRDLEKAYPEKSETKLPEIAEKHLLPEEEEGVSKSKAQQDKFIVRMTEMPELREWADAASKGAGERKWYQRSTAGFDAMAKEAPNYFDQEGDRDKFIGMLAAGSPQQSVAMNLREALRVWTNYVDNGRPTGAALENLLSKPSSEGGFTLPGAKIPNAMKALAGEPMWPDITKNKNFKVPSFRDNLTGMLQRVTNDGWMSLFAGLDARDISSGHSYH